MATRTNAPLWTIIYAILAVAIILALLQLLGVFTFTPALMNIISLLAIFAFLVIVIHLARLI
ncbi:MAG TPA: hypothetical protein VE439_10265 [Anaerolineae bacterium]|nr:hypothetical protein [Anaerolineae bacterium]